MMRGYDERFTTYGFEDSDMYCRLASCGICIKPDDTCRVVHPFHTKDTGGNKLSVMGEIFTHSDPNVFVRNNNGWGKG